MKLLIAEDDLTSRSILSAVTSKCGYQPVLAEDGEIAWNVMQQEDHPRLLLLDWEMPKLDGAALCQRIRQLESENPPYIILLTTRNESSDIAAGLEAGANDYIVKPFDNTELQARLKVGKRMLSLQAERLEAVENKVALQRQLQQAQKMEAIGQLTGGIAHDFNNILASIMGYTELLKDKAVIVGDSKMQHYLEQIYISSERARDLVAKMLAFSRESKTGGQALSLLPVLEDSLTMLSSIMTPSIELHTDFEVDLPMVLSNPIQIHQLVMNLCINARDAMQDNGRIDIGLKLVQLSGEVCDSCHDQIEGEYVELSVKDTGVGIESQILERIFEPFFTTKSLGKSTGMGLSLVHGIVHELGGHILVESSPDTGTLFRLMFVISKEPLDIHDSQ